MAYPSSFGCAGGSAATCSVKTQLIWSDFCGRLAAVVGCPCMNPHLTPTAAPCTPGVRAAGLLLLELGLTLAIAWALCQFAAPVTAAWACPMSRVNGRAGRCCWPLPGLATAALIGI